LADYIATTKIKGWEGVPNVDKHKILVIDDDKIIDVQTARIDNISVIITNMKKLLADFNEII